MNGNVATRARAVDRWLDAHPYWLAVIVAAVGYVALAPWGHAFGTGGEFARPTGDLAQGMTGAFAYIDDSWRWPLFETKRLAWPAGANIIFLDSIPIAALLFKIVERISGVRVAYQGLWFVLIWFGQAAGGVFVLRGLGVRRWLTLLVGTLVFLALPTFLHRHGHLALSGHFAILFALGIYWRLIAGRLRPRLDLAAPLLIAALVWVHFYLFTMSAAVYVAALLDAKRNHTKSLLDVASRAAAMIALALSLMWVGGYFGYSSRAGGFGHYSMNLLSPWAPQQSGWLGGPANFDGTGGQYEGFQYLGLGVLLAAAVTLGASLLVRRRGPHRTHRYLSLVCVLLTLFALSNHVYWDRKEIVTLNIDVDVFPFSAFRSGGRFFWPVGYLVVALSLSKLEVSPWWKARSVLSALALVLIAFVQAVDVRHFVVGFRNGLRGPGNSESAALAKLYGEHDVVHIAPKFSCAEPGTQHRDIELIYLAAKVGRLVDDVYTSRAREKNDCEIPIFRAADDDGRRHLYVGVAGPVAISDVVPLDEYCRKLGDLSLCSQNGPALSQLTDATTYELPACGDHMTFSTGSAAVAAEIAGWSHTEWWGTWSVASRAAIECRLTSSPSAVSITAQGFAPDTGNEDIESTAIGGGTANVALPHMSKTQWRVALGRTRTLMLMFRTPSMVSPVERGVNEDQRKLGVGLMSIDLIHDGG